MDVTNQEDQGYALSETLTHCPLCASKDFKPFANSYDRLYLLSKQRFEYSTCADCKVVFQSVRPLESEIAKFYPKNYGPYAGHDRTASKNQSAVMQSIRQGCEKVGKKLNSLLRKISRDRYEKDYKAIYKLPHANAEVLDFGCGSDAFLNRARKWGWKTTGMDFSEFAVEQAHASGHRALLLSADAWDEIEDGSIDLIRMNHVLEHLYDPREVMAKLFSKLKPGGRVHIAVPNPSSLSASVYRRFWFSLDCPRHIMLYSPKCGTHLLEQCGFKVDKILHEPVTKDSARSAVYVLKSAGLVPHRWVDSIIWNPFVEAALYFPIRIFSSLGKGERIHFICSKPKSAAQSTTLAKAA